MFNKKFEINTSILNTDIREHIYFKSTIIQLEEKPPLNITLLKCF
jgi:hypothetical protein